MIEDVPLRRFANDPTFMVALSFTTEAQFVPRAVGISSTFCSKDVIRSREL